MRLMHEVLKEISEHFQEIVDDNNPSSKNGDIDTYNCFLEWAEVTRNAYKYYENKHKKHKDMRKRWQTTEQQTEILRAKGCGCEV